MTSSTAHDRTAPVRVGRGVASASAVAIIAALGHALGDGSWLSGADLVPLLAVSAMAGAALSWVRWSPARLAWGLLSTQFLVHAALWIGSVSTSSHPRLTGLAVITSGASEHQHSSVAWTPRMLLAHAAAILVTVVALAAADRAVVLLVALVRRVSFSLSPVLVAPGFRPRGALAALARVAQRSTHLAVVRGNAPPVSLGLG